MQRKTKLIIAFVAILLVAAWLLWAASYRPTGSNNSSASSSSSPSPTSTQSSNSSSSTSADSTITYTSAGFSSDIYHAAAGSVVKIVNSSGGPLEFYSDPFTDHTDEPELNVGRIEQGSSTTFVVTQKGTWGFHNQLSPSETSTLVVE